MAVYQEKRADKYSVSGARWRDLEKRRRPESVTISAKGLPDAVIRDQKPMSDKGLWTALAGTSLTPYAWYALLNKKVFFWLSRDRLHRIIGAAAYQNREHEVLEVDTRSLIEAHRAQVWLCPMNSGCTRPFPRPRDKNTFARIANYPYSHWRKKRQRGERVVELAVDYAVPDIKNHVRRVVVKHKAKTVAVLWPKCWGGFSPRL